MLIGIDLDEVLAGSVGAFIDFHNERYKTNFTIGDFFSYQFEKVLGDTRDQSAKKVQAYYQTKYFKQLEPYPHAVSAVSKLKSDHELVVITARHKNIEKVTQSWLTKHFNDAFNQVHFAQFYHRENFGRKKSEICSSLGVDLMIEDSHEYASECAEVTKQVLLFDRPWNQEPLPERVLRVHTWEEALLAVEKCHLLYANKLA